MSKIAPLLAPVAEVVVREPRRVSIAPVALVKVMDCPAVVMPPVVIFPSALKVTVALSFPVKDAALVSISLPTITRGSLNPRVPAIVVSPVESPMRTWAKSVGAEL